MSKQSTDNAKGEASPVPAKPADQDLVFEDTQKTVPPREIGGRPGPDPTRYGDWEKAGRCIDF
jgi:hypothetical protein